MYTLHKGQKGLLIGNSMFIPFVQTQQSDASGGAVSDSQGLPTVSDSRSQSTYISDSITVPECTITHINGTQPTTGSVWYITPDGAGSMDGTSWDNAASGSLVHAILLSAAQGDRVYFSEGQYASSYTITLPAGVSLYGGFTAQNPSWATRDAFEHPTTWTASYSGAWLNCASDSISGQVVDGFTILNYVGAQQQTGNVTFRNGHVTGGVFHWTETIENSIFADTDVKTKYATGCYATGGTFSITRKAVTCKVYNAAAHLTAAQSCTAVKCVPDTSISPSIFYSSGNTDCIAIACNTLAPAGSSQNYLCDVFDQMSVRCTAIKCSSSGEIFDVQSEQCTAIQCNVTHSSGYQTTPVLFGRGAKKGKAINCSATGSTASVFSANSEACIAINCICQSSAIFYSNGSSDYHRNGLAINCEASTTIFRGTSVYSCNACNCTAQYAFIADTAKNCISWNNSNTDFHTTTQLTTCAGSVYDADLALVLGTDNTIARFTNTGFAPAQGVQDVGDCPSPVDDPDGYAEWLAAFGDWHPAANSFLLGIGTSDSSVTTDADGVTRPNPPSIGAYQAYPTTQ